MKFLILFFLNAFVCINAQTIRFVYNYKSAPDTLKKDIFVNELMVLDVDTQQKSSVFSNFNKIKSDSLMANATKNGLFLFPDSSIRTQFVIEKKLENKQHFFYTRNHTIVPVSKAEDTRQITWKIENEKKQILSYNAIRATTEFGGRKWTAWFTTEIPFPDGPYRFSGLPGLILEIYDSTGTQFFEIVSIGKVANKSYKILDNGLYLNAHKISFKDYVQGIIEDQKDPARIIRQKAFSGKIFFDNDQEKEKYLRDIDIKMKKEASENNNLIELYNNFKIDK